MSEMSPKESVERFSEGLKKASSRARELGKSTMNPIWNNIATSLEGIRIKGEKMISSKALTTAQVEAAVNDIEKGLKIPR